MKYRSLIALVALATALLPALVSCGEKEEVYKPTHNIKSADWYTVSASGGTIEVNDISITFPSGAFDKTEKVAVTPVKKGSVANASGRELSEFYQITFPEDGVKQPFTVSFNYSGDVKRVLVLQESYKKERYTQKTGLHTAALGGLNKNGKVSITIPGIDPAENSQPFCTLGLVDGTLSAAPSTKAAGTTFHYTVDWCIPTAAELKAFEPYREAILTVFRKEMSTVASVFYTLGIEMSEYPVPYVLIPVDKWGQHVTDNCFKASGIIEIDTKKFVELVKGGEPYNEDLYRQLQQTLVHETYHWIQDVVYDQRTCQSINRAGQSEWSMFSEAIATWLEQFTGNKRISENCPKFASSLIKDFFCSNGSDFETTGYGMGLYIKWLAGKTSNKKIVELLNYLKDNSGWFSVPSLRSAFDSFLANNKLEFFSPSTNWEQFVWDVIDKKIDARVDRDELGMDYITKIKSSKTKIMSADVYNFGFTVQRSITSEASFRELLEENPGLCLVYTQKADKLKTWLCDSDYKPLGAIEKDQQYVFKSNFFLKHKYHHTITYRIKQDTEPKVIVSNGLEAEIRPWVNSVSISFEKNGKHEYFGWEGWENGYDITVTPQSNGWMVKADYPSGAHLSFLIEKKGNKFGDATNINLKVDYDPSKNISFSRLALEGENLNSELNKTLGYKGMYQNNDVRMSLWLL